MVPSGMESTFCDQPPSHDSQWKRASHVATSEGLLWLTQTKVLRAGRGAWRLLRIAHETLSTCPPWRKLNYHLSCTRIGPGLLNQVQMLLTNEAFAQEVLLSQCCQSYQRSLDTATLVLQHRILDKADVQQLRRPWSSARMTQKVSLSAEDVARQILGRGTW